MAADPRISLFNVVQKMHEAGVVKLSGSDLDTLNRETRDLIEKSERNSKRAAKMPEGFEEVIGKLKSAEPQEVYDMIVEFLKEKGVIKDKGEKKEDGEKPEKGEKSEKGEKPDFGKGPGPHKEMKGPKGEGPEPGESPEHEMGESPAEEKAEHEDKMPFKGAQAEPQMSEEDEALDEGKERLKELQDRVEAVPATTSVESMGMMDDKKKGGKYRVLITAERNLVASHVEKGPLFYAAPSDEYKRNTKALKRLANQVMATLIFKGPKEAAALCGTKLLAGVDEGVETTGDMPVAPNKDSVTDNAEVVSEGGLDKPEDSALAKPENDTKEDPDTVKPTNREGVRKPARYEVITKTSDTSIDNVETDAQDKPDEAVKDVRDGAENVTVEDPDKPKDDTTADGEVDFQKVEANYRQLYSSRAKKMAEDAVKEFADKFNLCVRIASSRMRLNQDSHPFKVAAADVLLSDDVEFSDGDKFVPMDARTASELIELISAEGHDTFVTHLLARAADLMDKDMKYLSDVDADLQNLAPISVPSETKVSGRTAKSSIRDKAIAGSFAANDRVLSQHPEKINKEASVREAIVGNRLGRRLDSLRG